MLIVSNTFFGYGTAVASAVVPAQDAITNTTLKNGTFDDFLVSTNVDTPIPLDGYEWGYDTLFWAKFDGTLDAGNMNFVLETIDAVLVKRRRVEDFTWVSLFVVPVSKIEDLSFDRFDTTVASQQEYEYAIVPMVNGVEGQYSVQRIYVSFEGMFVVGTDRAFASELEAYVPSVTKDSKSTIVETLGRKFPFIINNSINDYYRGNATGVFVRVRDDCELDFSNSYAYRHELMSFLNNKKPKILKVADGRLWLCSVVDAIQENQDRDTEKITTSFVFAEIGDSEDQKDLYNSGFTELYEYFGA